MRAMLSTGLCVLALSCGIAHSQELSGFTGTIGVTASTMSRQGRMAGCELNYNASVQDFAYRQGALVGVSGSFTLSLLNQSEAKGVVGMLKIGLQQVIPPATGGPEAPAFAYLASEHGSTAKSVVKEGASDTPGFRLYVLKVDDALMGVVGDMLRGQPITLYYSRTATGLDVKVSLDLRVVDSKAGPNGFQPIRGDATVDGFASCFERLAKELK